jgi:hypothetical protein
MIDLSFFRVRARISRPTAPELVALALILGAVILLVKR